MSETATVERLEGGSNDGALFLGIEEGERVFWDYRTDELVKESHNETFALGGEFVGAYVADAADRGLWGRSSRIGAFLEAVARYGDAPGMLGERQAVVFALREMAGVSRVHTHRALGLSASTVDSTLQTARAKVGAFMAVAESLEESE